jgi:hypothetical protein
MADTDSLLDIESMDDIARESGKTGPMARRDGRSV